MTSVNDVANMFGCDMPTEADPIGNCAVNASMDGTMADPKANQLCDKVIEDQRLTSS